MAPPRKAIFSAGLTPDRVLDLGNFGAPLVLDDRLRNVLRVSGVRWAYATEVPPPLPRARLVSRAIEFNRQTFISKDPRLDTVEAPESPHARGYPLNQQLLQWPLRL